MRFLRPALVAVLCLGATTAALARGRREVHARVDLTTGTVTMLAAPPTTVTALTTPRAAAPWVASDDAGVVTVRAAGGKDPLKLAVGKLAYEWMPWSAFQPGLFLFDWRERVVVPGKPDAYRDVLRGVDLATGAELWQRETTGAAPVGDRRLLLHTGAGFDLVDSRTGKLERHLALAGGGPTALSIAGGDTLIDTGQVLARLDASGTVAWHIDHLGPLVSVTPLGQPAARYVPDPRNPAAPLPATGAWAVVTRSRLAVLDPVTGKLRWSAASSAASMLIDGAQILTAEIVRAPTGSSATVKLTVRELATGKLARELAVLRHDHFFDTATAVVAARRGNLVDVTSEFVVLD